MAIQAKNCSQCNNIAKYKCPRCEIFSCSAVCVSKHKQENDCDGVRSKTKYKAIGKFTELDLVNDFRLLEEATRQVER